MTTEIPIKHPLAARFGPRKPILKRILKLWHKWQCSRGKHSWSYGYNYKADSAEMTLVHIVCVYCGKCELNVDVAK